MAVVRIPSVLRKHTGGVAKVEASGRTVREVIDDLAVRYPALRDQLLDSGELRGFVNVYVDDEDVRYLDGLDTPVPDDAEVAVMPAVAGGAWAQATGVGAGSLRGAAGGGQATGVGAGSLRGGAGGGQATGVGAGSLRGAPAAPGG